MYFVAIVVSCVAFFAFGAAEPQCHMQEAFSCLDIGIAYINSLPRRSLPKTEEEVDVFCSAENHTLSCLVDFGKRCMTPIQRELVSLIGEGYLDFYDQACVSVPSPIRTNYLAHAECLNKVTQGEKMDENLKYLLAAIERLMVLPYSEMIEYLCCGYTKIYDLIRKDVVNTCSEEAAQSLENIVQLVIAGLPEVICSGVDGDSEKCTAILPPPGAKPTEKIKQNSLYKYVFTALKDYLE